MKYIVGLFFLSACAWAQSGPRAVISPEVHPDRSVTFRLRDPNAKAVMLAREGSKPVLMQKDDSGVWNFTTEPLEPDFYGYTFQADGVTLLDPGNSLFKPNLLNVNSAVHVPGPPSLPWEINDVPHGVVQHHFYKSAIVGDDRDYFVYTPPGYDAKSRQRYPVLYLLHGYSDDASGWTAVGRANIILDNLIAQGKAKPMLIVMTLGYGAPEIVTRNRGGSLSKALTTAHAEFIAALAPETDLDWHRRRLHRPNGVNSVAAKAAESRKIARAGHSAWRPRSRIMADR